MATLSDKIIGAYNYVLTDLADTRTNNFFLIPSPVPILTMTVLYLYFSTSFGPKYMQNRQPYKLKNVLIVYNAFQVAMNLWLFSAGFRIMLSDQFSFNCQPLNYSLEPSAVQTATMGWWYFFSKVLDYLDTIFFVLRKKNNQITFLHVYHHSMMAFCTWIGVKYFASGQGIVMATLNSFVHVVMYTYYLISGLGPEYQKYVWWKKHVTVLQLVQFVIILVHALNGLLNGCSYPKAISILLCINAAIFINLFGKFFIKSYLKSGDNKNGTIKNGTATNGAVKNGTATNGAVNNGTAKSYTASNGTNGHIHTYKDGIKNGGENVIANGKHKED